MCRCPFLTVVRTTRRLRFAATSPSACCAAGCLFLGTAAVGLVYTAAYSQGAVLLCVLPVGPASPLVPCLICGAQYPHLLQGWPGLLLGAGKGLQQGHPEAGAQRVAGPRCMGVLPQHCCAVPGAEVHLLGRLGIKHTGGVLSLRYEQY